MNDFQVTRRRMMERIQQTKWKIKQLVGNQYQNPIKLNVETLQQNHSKLMTQQHYTNLNQKDQIKLLKKLQKQYEDNQHRLNALQNFPFGKQRASIVSNISEIMNQKHDEDNKKMLQKFRIQAIQFRNFKNRYISKGKTPYLTSSMMHQNQLPNSKAIQLIKRPIQQRRQINHNSTIFQNNQNNKIGLKNYSQSLPFQYPPQNYKFNYLSPQNNPHPNQMYQIYHRKQQQPTRYKSIAVDTHFIDVIKEKEKKKNKIRQLKLEQRQYDKNKIRKLEMMIKRMNLQLKKNTQLINDSIFKLSQSKYQSMESIQNSEQKEIKKSNNKNNFLRQTKRSKCQSPIVQYTNKGKSKTQQSEDISKHLVLLKKHKKRLDTIQKNPHA